MRDPKETFGGMTTENKSKGLREVETTTKNSPLQTGNTATKPVICHGSVCLGNQKPTHCICPTDKK
ncbi:MAG: hypothetical protein FD174_3183 [Geobacteraceae bacterium]|nr:MAG: hypothetical protein FD174_3183 [Geobacteraceae bacterium]